jgi:pimeloyl-ACP methyl ester carboxylesterase
LSFDMGSDSRTLLIAFGGLRGRVEIPPFEFLTLTGDFPVKRIFVRDLHQAWYHRGTPRHGATTLTSLADSLRERVAAHDVDRLVTAGNSAGGYAALVFGTLLGADTVLSFAPQTVLDPEILAAWGDRRWEDQLRRLAAAGSLDPRWLDLRNALPQARRADTRYQVYFDDALRVDRLHAERLRGIQGMHLYRFGNHTGHYLVHALRNNGALERVLRQAVGAPQSAPNTEDGIPKA